MAIDYPVMVNSARIKVFTSQMHLLKTGPQRTQVLGANPFLILAVRDMAQC